MRFKSFPAKIALAVAITISAAMSAAAPDAIVLPPVPTTVDSITPGELRMHLQFLASEELGGRYTLSPGFAIAARYLAAHLEAYGFKGAGDNGGFLQTFQVVSSKAGYGEECAGNHDERRQDNVLPFRRFLHACRRAQW